MIKVPCGGFELGDSLVINDGKLDVKPSVYIVTFSTDETGEVIIADKTYAEIASANEKMPVFGRISLEGSNAWFSCAGCNFENGAIFTNIIKQKKWMETVYAYIACKA